MEEAFLTFIGQYGYIAVFSLIVLENVFPPIPGTVILPFSGYMVLLTDMEMVPTIAAATAGSLVGAYIYYAVGRILSQERLEALLSTKVMHMLGFESDDVAKAVNFFNNKGQISVLIGRCIPVVRSVISIPAGTAKMNFAKFTVYSLIGIVIWNVVLCVLGYYAGEAWEKVVEQVEWLSYVVVILIIASGVVCVIWWVVKRIVPNVKEYRAEKNQEQKGQ